MKQLQERGEASDLILVQATQTTCWKSDARLFSDANWDKQDIKICCKIFMHILVHDCFHKKYYLHIKDKSSKFLFTVVSIAVMEKLQLTGHMQLSVLTEWAHLISRRKLHLFEYTPLVGDRSRGRPKGSLFNSYYTEM